MQRRMVCFPCVFLPCKIAANNRSQLTKEDEDAAGEEVEVRREDQDKINKFSRLHQRELSLEEDLQTKTVRLPGRVAEDMP